jgi:hypothetical protein
MAWKQKMPLDTASEINCFWTFVSVTKSSQFFLTASTHCMYVCMYAPISDVNS